MNHTQNPRRAFGRSRWLFAAAASAALLLSACTSTDAPASDPGTASATGPAVVGEASIAGMKILITNDDSMQASRENNSDGLGLYEMRKALCSAGADVVVIAPWAVQSGKGTAVTNSGTFTAQAAGAIPAAFASDCASAPSAGAVFGVCLAEGSCAGDSPSATPADTVKFAMRGGLEALVGWKELPDLVVTGPNAGLNVASSVNDSGTLGAAIAAIEQRVPAVAFSTASADQQSYNPKDYQATSAWAAKFLQSLAARDMLSQHDFAISVNYPVTTSEAPVGTARFVEVGTAVVAYHYYTSTGDNTFKVALKICEGAPVCEESKSDADWQAAMKGNAITVGAITPDRTYGTQEHAMDSLNELRAFVTSDAPAPVS